MKLWKCLGDMVRSVGGGPEAGVIVGVLPLLVCGRRLWSARLWKWRKEQKRNPGQRSCAGLPLMTG